jgi:acyl carrier protein
MVSDRLKKVILDELELEDYEIEDETTATMVPGWDSLNHVKIITAIENEYKIRFKTVEVIRLKNVGELQKLVDARAV